MIYLNQHKDFFDKLDQLSNLNCIVYFLQKGIIAEDTDFNSELSKIVFRKKIELDIESNKKVSLLSINKYLKLINENPNIQIFIDEKEQVVSIIEDSQVLAKEKLKMFDTSKKYLVFSSIGFTDVVLNDFFLILQNLKSILFNEYTKDDFVYLNNNGVFKLENNSTKIIYPSRINNMIFGNYAVVKIMEVLQIKRYKFKKGCFYFNDNDLEFIYFYEYDYRQKLSFNPSELKDEEFKYSVILDAIVLKEKLYDILTKEKKTKIKLFNLVLRVNNDKSKKENQYPLTLKQIHIILDLLNNDILRTQEILSNKNNTISLELFFSKNVLKINNLYFITK